MDITTHVVRKNVPAIIFGMGAAGEALLYSCRDAGIEVVAFCDNNIVKTQNPLLGVRAVHASKLQEQFNSQNVQFIISAANIADVVMQLDELGFSQWYPGSLLLKDTKLEGRAYTKTLELVQHAVETVLICHADFLNPGRIFMRSVDVVVTEKCSMKCVDCSNLMQYYEKPINFDMDTVLGWVKAFSNNVDEIGEIRVIGGEPFMNKETHLIVHELALLPKIKKVVIYTNATIPLRPVQLESMKHDKVVFMITDYDELSKNHEQVTQVLTEYGIKFISLKARGWTDCGTIKRHYRDVEQQKDVFKNCCANKLFTLMDGKFFRCPFAANALQLKAVPNFHTDYIDVMNGDVREELRSYTFEKEYLESCDYCNGRRLDDPEIVPAIQTVQIVPFQKHV